MSGGSWLGVDVRGVFDWGVDVWGGGVLPGG